MRHSGNNVIYIEEVKKSLRKKEEKAQNNKQLGTNSSSSNNYKFINPSITHATFQQSKKYLLDNLKTRKSRFKFPTILSQYRKGINPVSSVYESSQKAIINNGEDWIDAWVLELIKNKEFIDDIIMSLETDIFNIKDFIEKFSKDNKFLSELQPLYNQFKLYIHYIKVFKIISEW